MDFTHTSMIGNDFSKIIADFWWVFWEFVHWNLSLILISVNQAIKWIKLVASGALTENICTVTRIYVYTYMSLTVDSSCDMTSIFGKERHGKERIVFQPSICGAMLGYRSLPRHWNYWNIDPNQAWFPSSILHHISARHHLEHEQRNFHNSPKCSFQRPSEVVSVLKWVYVWVWGLAVI